MEPTTELSQFSPLSVLGTIIGWLGIGLAIVFTMLAVLRLLDRSTLPEWRGGRRRSGRR